MHCSQLPGLDNLADNLHSVKFTHDLINVTLSVDENHRIEKNAEFPPFESSFFFFFRNYVTKKTTLERSPLLKKQNKKSTESGGNLPGK